MRLLILNPIEQKSSVTGEIRYVEEYNLKEALNSDFLNELFRSYKSVKGSFNINELYRESILNS